MDQKVNEYLTIKDIISLSSVNSKFYDYADADKIWDYHYEATWKKVYEENHLNDPNDICTKEKCIKAFVFHKKQYLFFIFFHRFF